MNHVAAIMPVAYLPPLPYYTAMLHHDSVIWDIYEFFHKQCYYNRCVIYGANGPLKLIIPLQKRHEKTPVKDVKINYLDDWQKLHWRSLEASYRRSPYFEYFENTFYPLYNNFQPETLLEWDRKLFETVNKLLGISLNFSYTSHYEKSYPGAVDCRNLVYPAAIEHQTKYRQVFEEKHGFLPNLSIIDLLFCEGSKDKINAI